MQAWSPGCDLPGNVPARAGFEPILPISSNRAPRLEGAPRKRRQSYGFNIFLYSKRSILGHNLKRALFCFDHRIAALFLAPCMLAETRDTKKLRDGSF